MIYLLSDHGGYQMKEKIAKHLTKKNIEFVNLGTNDTKSVSYSQLVKDNIHNIKQDDKAIFVCGTGIGISIAANKYDEIRCALCYDTHSAKMARNHNNANVLALKGRKACALKTMKIVDTFLNSEFEGGRHEERVNLLSNMRD